MIAWIRDIFETWEAVIVYGVMALVVVGIGYGASTEQQSNIERETQYRQSCIDNGGRVVSADGDGYKYEVMPENVEHATCLNP